MKALLYIALFMSAQVDVDQVRSLFTVAHEDKAANEKLLEFTDGYTLDYKPVIYAYHAAAIMTMANHISWPGTKLSYFSEGKEKLEKVVKAYPDNVEIRYIRFAVQYGSPTFLGYRSDLDVDRNFVLEHLDAADLPAEQVLLIKATVNQK
ncbi:MAG: hypothetical protein HUJ25_11415 [Crocinitomicaceae bacterium]|nr:hypothetical protein [Crocinitomicaceae bacterium]